MDKAQLAKLDLTFSTIHLLNAAAEGMDKLEHKPFSRQCRIMVIALSKSIDKIIKGGGQQ